MNSRNRCIFDLESSIERATDSYHLVGGENFRPPSIFQGNLAHRIALKANGLRAAAVTVVPEIADFTTEPTELVAVTARRSFLVELAAGTTRWVLSYPEISEQVEGTGTVAVTAAVAGQLNHW